MSRATLLIFSLIFLGACAGPQLRYESDADPDEVESESRTLNGTYEKVWRAAQLALAEYPIRLNNQEAGIIETEFIKSDQGFRVPGQERKTATGRRYKISLKVFKGTGDKSIVVIRKNIDAQKDFFSAAEKVASDGLEELAIMYRVERELNLDKAADRAAAQ